MKTKTKYYNKILIILVLATLFMAVGYASVNSTIIDIKGKVSSKKQTEVYITDVVHESNINANVENSKIINAYQTMLNSNITLSDTDKNSQITYKIEVYNSSEENYYFYKSSYLEGDNTYSNNDIIYELSGISAGDSLKSKESMTFLITFKYKDNTTLKDNNLNSYINFIFKKKHTITYENITAANNLPNYIYDEEKLEINLENITNPIEVSMNNKILSSNEYTYSNNKLTINSVKGNIHIRMLKKYTITNIVKNGSFEDVLTNWTVQGGSSNSWLTTHISSFGSKGIYRVAPSEATKNYITQSIYWKNNHKYYFYAYAISTSYQPFVCDITNKGGSFNIQVGPERFSKGSTLYTSNFTGNNTISINYAKITVNVIVDGVGVIDLTEGFGSGNEPSLNWCDSNISYFDNTTTIYK